jgi:hypothetical protein
VIRIPLLAVFQASQASVITKRTVMLSLLSAGGFGALASYFAVKGGLKGIEAFEGSGKEMKEESGLLKDDEATAEGTPAEIGELIVIR